MDSSAEQTFMRTGRNSGWRPVRLRPVRVSFRCPSGARAGLVVVGLHVGGARSTHTTLPGRRQMLRHMQGGARLTACYSLLERSSSERTRRPTPARPPNQQIDLLRRRGTRARGAACVCGVAGVLQPAALGCSAGSCRPSGSRAPPALAGCGVVYHRPVRSARLAHDSW